MKGLSRLLLRWALFSNQSFVVRPAEAGDATFLGNSACAGYHRPQTNDWTGSHHDLAMQEAAKTVLGDFDNAKFVYESVTTTFFKREGTYWVNTDNEKGELSRLSRRIRIWHLSTSAAVVAY